MAQNKMIADDILQMISPHLRDQQWPTGQGTAIHMEYPAAVLGLQRAAGSNSLTLSALVQQHI